MVNMFLYGTLRHLPLLGVVLGRVPDVVDARLDGYDVRGVSEGSFPVILQAEDARIDGLLALRLGPDELARVDYYEAAFGYALRDCEVRVADGNVAAQVYFALGGGPEVAGPWVLAEWERDWAEVTVLAAREFMDGFGEVPAQVAATRYPQMLMRAATRLRAGLDTAPSAVRVGPGRLGVQTQDWRRPYSEFFVLEEHDVRFARFGGGFSETVTRAALVGGDAVTVLPYDPVRDRVMLVEQFRIGPHIRGDQRAWTLEPIAGRIDPGEGPEQAARREMLEEAGLAVTEMLPLPNYYPSPGAYSEFLYTFVGIADLPDAAAGVGGLADEGEDIKSHILQFEAAMELVSSGEANTGPLILSLLWLQGQRDLIRQSVA